MTQLKLAQLPERTPVKITLLLPRDLQHLLEQYAVLYEQVYRRAEPVSELIPHMLRAFMSADRDFMKGLAARNANPLHTDEPVASRP